MLGEPVKSCYNPSFLFEICMFYKVFYGRSRMIFISIFASQTLISPAVFAKKTFLYASKAFLLPFYAFVMQYLGLTDRYYRRHSVYNIISLRPVNYFLRIIVASAKYCGIYFIRDMLDIPHPWAAYYQPRFWLQVFQGHNQREKIIPRYARKKRIRI